MLVAALSASALSASSVFAQTGAAADGASAPAPVAGPVAGKVRSRGVRVLQPDAAPADPAPAIVPAQPSPQLDGQAQVPPPAPPARPTTAPVVVSVIKACARPIAAPDLHADAAADLRPTLGMKLRGHQRVVLDLMTPYPAAAPAPAGLAPWLAEVKSSGGTVTVDQYCQRTRSAFGNFVARILGLLPNRAYRDARAYNVVLHVDALDQVVTQVEFAPRAGAPS